MQTNLNISRHIKKKLKLNKQKFKVKTNKIKK